VANDIRAFEVSLTNVHENFSAVMLQDVVKEGFENIGVEVVEMDRQRITGWWRFTGKWRSRHGEA
jgi:hypothetical protein